ncbi:MAG: BrnT family toxin [Acidobacteriaceae bacterium]
MADEASAYFSWNAKKAAANLRKHKVSFEEAASVFEDSLADVLADPDHSMDEHRLLLLGKSRLGRVLVVAFTERVNVIRIISARVTTRSERKDYEENV